MWSTFGRLLQWLHLQEWTDETLLVRGHKEVQPKPTECPGKFIMDGIKNKIWEPDVEYVTRAEFYPWKAEADEHLDRLLAFEDEVRRL
jgi:hypothetical protein